MAIKNPPPMTKGTPLPVPPGPHGGGIPATPYTGGPWTDPGHWENRTRNDTGAMAQRRNGHSLPQGTTALGMPQDAGRASQFDQQNLGQSAGGAMNMQDGAFDPMSELGQFLESLFAGVFGGQANAAPATAAPPAAAPPAAAPPAAAPPAPVVPVPPHRPAALSPTPKGGTAFADPGAQENAWRHPGAGAPPPLPPRRPGAGAMDGWKDPGQIKY